jgi:hypothetical protein
MCNSVLSTEGVKCMGLDIKTFYLAAQLDRFEYMKMPLFLFPDWIKKQYELDKHALNGFVYLEMRRAIWCGASLGGTLDYIPNPTLRLKKRSVFTFGRLIAS